MFLCGLCLLPVFCGQKGSQETATEDQAARVPERSEIEAEYNLIQAELRLARTEKPYLVIDAGKNEMRLKLKGATVWYNHLELLESESDRLDQFAGRFLGSDNRILRLMTEKHLFASSDKTPDSILAIVGEVVKVDPELLQREIPERFQLLWDHSLILEVRTGQAGKPASFFKNTMLEVRRTLQRPFGESYLAVKMNPEEALTLYRVSQPGLPTLIYPAR